MLSIRAARRVGPQTAERCRRRGAPQEKSTTCALAGGKRPPAPSEAAPRAAAGGAGRRIRLSRGRAASRRGAARRLFLVAGRRGAGWTVSGPEGASPGAVRVAESGVRARIMENALRESQLGRARRRRRARVVATLRAEARGQSRRAGNLAPGGTGEGRLCRLGDLPSRRGRTASCHGRDSRNVLLGICALAAKVATRPVGQPGPAGPSAVAGLAPRGAGGTRRTKRPKRTRRTRSAGGARPPRPSRPRPYSPSSSRASRASPAGVPVQRSVTSAQAR